MILAGLGFDFGLLAGFDFVDDGFFCSDCFLFEGLDLGLSLLEDFDEDLLEEDDFEFLLFASAVTVKKIVRANTNKILI